MRLPGILLIAAFAVACSGAGKKEVAISKPEDFMNSADTSIHPLLDIGGCYLYEIKKDTIAGLTLVAITKEEDSVYYAFLLSGKFFRTMPSKDEFSRAGICGLEIPTYSAGNIVKSFSKYFISENNLKPHLQKLKKIDNIKISQKNDYGSMVGVEKFEDLKDEFRNFEIRNLETAKQIQQTGLPVSKYAIIDWNHLIKTDKPEEMVRPEIIWVLSARSAHPKAAALMKEDWWWSQIDDLSPFGNDDGSDAFHFFKDWREKNPNAEPASFIPELEKSWGISFSHINQESEKDLPYIEKANMFYRNIDRSVIAIAFGQFVLEGQISSSLKKLAIKAIKRTRSDFGLNGMTEGNKIEYRDRLEKMEQILLGL